MENILNKFTIEISIQEFKQKIKEYYLNLDDSITEVNVKYSSRWVQGTWNDDWEYYSGGYRAMEANVEIIRQINTFGEKRTVKISQIIGNNNFVHILSVLLEKDNLKATFVDEIESSGKIKISCEEIINQDKKEASSSGKDTSMKIKKRRKEWK